MRDFDSRRIGVDALHDDLRHREGPGVDLGMSDAGLRHLPAPASFSLCSVQPSASGMLGPRPCARNCVGHSHGGDQDALGSSAWRRRRRTECQRARLDHTTNQEARDFAKAERAREWPHRRPSSAGRTRWAAYIETGPPASSTCAGAGIRKFPVWGFTSLFRVEFPAGMSTLHLPASACVVSRCLPGSSKPAARSPPLLPARRP